MELRAKCTQRVRAFLNAAQKIPLDHHEGADDDETSARGGGKALTAVRPDQFEAVGMKVLVMTIVHHPEDARILHRQIAALRRRGHEVIYAAPFGDTRSVPRPGLGWIDLPRATGRSRHRAFLAARHLLAHPPGGTDVILMHDPELSLAALSRGSRPRSGPVLVWDVHEDTASTIALKRYLPAWLRQPLRLGVRAMESLSERKLRLLLAEDAYQHRFRSAHPVVPNFVAPLERAPEPGTERVVYLGHVSMARGALDLIEMARLLHPQVRLDVIGPADLDVREALAAADRSGILRWHGFVPNDQALGLLRGAAAGLSLLHDHPNYAQSMPTKIAEYMMSGLPVIATPLPIAVDLVQRHGCGAIVPFGRPDRAAEAVRALVTDHELRIAQGAAGFAAAVDRLNWSGKGDEFVRQLELWAAENGPASVVAPQLVAGLPAAAGRR